MTRITNLMQSQVTLANLTRNQFDLNDLSNQLSSQQKTQSFSGIASQANQYLNTASIQSRSQSYLDTITRTNTRLSLMDQNLTAIQKIASDFQSNLAQQANSTTPPTISQLAKNALASLSSYLNATDGSESLFSGSRLSQSAVTNLAANPNFPSKIAALTGNLPTAGTQNTQVNPPTPGSFLDAAVDQSEAVIDSSGIGNKVSIRFVKVGDDDPTTAADELRYDAYLTGISRVDNGAPATSPALSIANQVKLNATPFNPRDLSTLTAQAAQPSVASQASVAAIGTTPSVASKQSIPSIPSSPAGLLTFQVGRGSVPQLANGADMFVQIGSTNFAKTPATPGSFAVTAVDNKQNSGDNANPTQSLRLNGTLSALQGVGTTVDAVADGAYAIYDSNGNGHRVVVRYTKTETDIPGVPGDPTAIPPIPNIVGQSRNIWRADIISMTNVNTGQNSTVPAASVSNPIQVSAVINATTTAPTALGTITIPSGGFQLADPTGAADPLATMSVPINAGDLGTTAPGSNITLAYNVPVPTAPAAGSPTLVRMGLNFSVTAPVNASVSVPTPGSFADITYNNAEALVDSGGNRHDVKLRIVRNPTQGVPLGNTRPFNVYIISMKQSATGDDSTNPPLTELAPQLIGSFDPADGTTAVSADPITGKLTINDPSALGTIRPKLKTGHALNVRLPFLDATNTSPTFTTTAGSTTLSRPENTTTSPYKTTATTALLVSGTLSSAATPVLFGPVATNATDAAYQAAVSAATVNSTNTVTVRYTGASALVDSKGVAYNATVRFQYQISDVTGGRPAWVATLTDVNDPATGKTIGGFTPTRLTNYDPNVSPITATNKGAQGFNPADTLRGPLQLGPIIIADSTDVTGKTALTTPSGGSLNISLPINSATFSTSGATALVPGGEAPTALSANITDTSYFQTPNPPSADTTNSQLTARVSDDLTLNYGIRADNLAFENLVRVLNFMQSQSTPPSLSDVQSAQTLLSSSITGVQTLRSQVAGNQITLNDEKNYHQTVVNLAIDARSNILSSDTTEVGVKITDLKTILEASYATLSTIRSLSLSNFLK